jgi:Ca2+:H+ antiporter
MLGSILSNILLVLGCSFLAAGYKFKESNFQVTAAQASSSLMVLGTSTLVIPAAYHASRLEKPDGMSMSADLLEGFKNKDLQGLLTLSRGTAIVSRNHRGGRVADRLLTFLLTPQVLIFCYAACGLWLDG